VTFSSFIFLFVHQISREALNGFASNSQARRVWSLAQMSLNVMVTGSKVKGKIARDKNALCTPITPTATEWSHLLHAARYNALSTGACVRFVFGKTSVL